MSALTFSKVSPLRSFGAVRAATRPLNRTMKTTVFAASPSIWQGVPQAPPDPILGVSDAFRADPSDAKFNLGVGAYRTEEGKPLVLNVVREVEQELALDTSLFKEYLPIGGNAAFCAASRELAFGADSKVISEGRIATVQCLSGTGSLRVAAEFIATHYGGVKKILLPNPTWGNHKKIFPNGGVEFGEYRYYEKSTRGLDFDGLSADLNAAEDGTVVLLHACAHNPTGVDPTEEQWKGILEIVQRKKLLPLFDSAYQGFASGSLEKDAAALRMFADAGVEMILAQSYAKNMGLYGERVGALSFISSDGSVTKQVQSQLCQVIRPMYSSPPGHGAAIAAGILTNPARFEAWKVELEGMANRIILMRTKLYDALKAKGTPGDWTHIINQIGMFTYTGLSKPQVEHMTNKHHVYMTMDGRISMAGLAGSRVDDFANAIDDAVRNVSA